MTSQNGISRETMGFIFMAGAIPMILAGWMMWDPEYYESSVFVMSICLIFAVINVVFGILVRKGIVLNGLRSSKDP